MQSDWNSVRLTEFQKVLQYFAYRTQKTPFQVADKEASTAVRAVLWEVTGKYATENDIKETQLEITLREKICV